MMISTKWKHVACAWSIGGPKWNIDQPPGVTIKSTGVSLYFEHEDDDSQGPKPHLINLTLGPKRIELLTFWLSSFEPFVAKVPKVRKSVQLGSACMFVPLLGL